MTAPRTNCAPECVRGWHVEGCPNAPIPATLRHDAEAVARCSWCQRYSMDPLSLADLGRQPVCECGRADGWSGSFEPPGDDAVWSSDHRIPPGHVGIVDPPPVPLHGPSTCDQHGPTVTVEWTSGGPDACPLCSAARLAYEARVEAGEAMLLVESAEANVRRLREAGGNMRYICSACGVPARPARDVDMLDSGQVLTCAACGGATVVDLDGPEDRAARYAAQAEVARLRETTSRALASLAECVVLLLRRLPHVAGCAVRGALPCDCGHMEAIRRAEALLAAP